MTVIPLHPLLRRTTGPERRNQPSEVSKLAVAFERSSMERLSSKSVAITTWLELLFGSLSIDATFGSRGDVDLPPASEVLNALVQMAEGTRKKALIPCAALPLEIALLRRGANVLVSLYHTEASPDVIVLDRRVPLRACLDATADVVGAESIDAHAQKRSERARTLEITEDRDTGLSATRQRGGVVDDPGESETLAFGFEAAIFPSAETPRDGVSHADVHAMLFGGQLWAYVRGRRVPLVRSGPILLTVQRMVSVIASLVSAWEEDRALHVRLRSGSFLVAVRRDRKDSNEVSLTLGSEDDGAITIPALPMEDACLPVLRLAAELLRALVSVDRMQSRNLRVASLREEVRRLRRAVRMRSKMEGFTNQNAERLREVLRSEDMPSEAPAPRAPASALRFATKWSVVVDGLDATTTFFCGDRLVLSNERRMLALDREDGQCLWQHEGPAQSAFLADANVVRLGADGTVEIRDLETGELAHRVRLAPRVGGSAFGLYVGGSGVPPIGLVAEGRDRLAAIDLRTGELRFRYTARSPGSFRLRRAGRLVLVVNGDGIVDALDVVSGEVVWRHASAAKFCLTPVVSGSIAIALSGEPGRGEASLVGLDLATGEELYSFALGAPAATAPQLLDGRVILALAGARRGVLAAHDPETGELQWVVSDPGVGMGGGIVSTEGALYVNASTGKLTALDPATGETRFSRVLANPVTDDVPRRLTPLVRGGALFVPSANAHVVRLADGLAIGAAPPCDLVPDALHVDERGWMYVAEESGHLAALAPMQTLRLIKGRA